MARYLYEANPGGATKVSEDFPQSWRELWVDVPYHESAQVGDVVKHLYPAHPVTIQRILDGDHRQPSVLVQDEAVVFSMADHAGDLDGLKAHRLGVFVGRHFLLTVHIGGPSHVVTPAWQFILDSHLMDEGVDFALYELLDHHVTRFASLYVQALHRYESLQDRLLQHPSTNLASDILQLRRMVMHMHKIIHPEQEIFVLLKSAHVPYISSHHRPYFEDVASRASELSADVDSLLDGLSDMVQSYTGMQSNEINKIMKFLTIVSVLALPATTIASIYGMNFYIPEVRWHYGYWYSLLVMLLVTTVLLIYMRGKRWLR